MAASASAAPQSCGCPTTAKFCQDTGKPHLIPKTEPCCANPSAKYCSETGEAHDTPACSECSTPSSKFCSETGREHGAPATGDTRTASEVHPDEPSCWICEAGENEPCKDSCEDKEDRDARISEVGRPAKSRRTDTPDSTAAAAGAGGAATTVAGAPGQAIPANPDMQLTPAGIKDLETDRLVALPVRKVLQIPPVHRMWIWGRKSKPDRARAYDQLVGSLNQIARPDDDKREFGNHPLSANYIRTIKSYIWIYKALLDPDPDLSLASLQARVQSVIERITLEILTVPMVRKKPMEVVQGAIELYFNESETDRMFSACLARAEKDHKDTRSPGSPGGGGGNRQFRTRGGGGGGGGGGSGGQGAGGNKPKGKKTG